MSNAQPTITPTEAAPSLKQAAQRSSHRFDLLRRLRKHPSAVAGGSVLLVILVLTLTAPLIAPYDPIKRSNEVRQGPSLDHWLGTDGIGRDIWSRVLWGGRISLLLGLIAVAIGGMIGTTLGLLAGYFRGYVEIAIMQFIDILLAFPGFLLALAAVAILGTGINNVMIAVGIALVPGFARVVRGSTLTIREMTYVESARVVGVGHIRTMTRYVLPNVLAPIMVLATVDIAGAILTGAALSFLGMGAQPPTPEWGLMVNEGRSVLRDAWWITTFPGIAIMISVISINLVGDALRDVLDPRMRT